MALLLGVLFMAAGPGFVAAQAPLVPQGGWVPGEFGVLLGGAQVALASGAEAAWFNPAGMAKEGRNAWSLGGLGAGTTRAGWGQTGSSGVSAAPTNFSVLLAPGEGRGQRRFNYGFFAGVPAGVEVTARQEEQQVSAQEAVPDDLAGGYDLDGPFPEGITRTAATSGAGGLGIGTVGVAFGWVLADGVRFGGAAQWEQVRLSRRSEGLVTFQAGDDPADALDAWEETSSDFRGVAERLAYRLGFQVDLTPGIILGISLRLPSLEQGGRGDLLASRSGRLTVTSGGGTVVDNTVFSHIDERNAAFRLRSPAEVRVGIALVFETLAVEFDLVHSGKVGAYEVFPEAQSSPPSTSPVQVAALKTSLEPVTGFALGVAANFTGGGSFLFGLAHEVSGVPSDDPLFQRVNISTLSMGYALPRGRFSASGGVVYRFGRTPGANLPGGTEEVPLTGDLEFEFLGVVGGLSYLF